MKAAVFAYSRRGCETAGQVIRFFGAENVDAFTMERFGQPGFLPIGRPPKPFYGEIFRRVDAMVFVGSVGIAVREIAPHVRDKSTDPAVVSIDELGRFAVPLLSGHIGGANDLALALANALGATPVITTATDIHHKFSVDAWAARNRYVIANLSRAKAVSAAILEGDVPLCSDFPVVTELPGGVVPGDSGQIGIYISCKKEEPFEKTLRLIPPILHLGIGCRRGVTSAAIAEAVDTALKEHRIDPRGIKCAASIDLKAEEPGLLEFCRERGLPVSFYSSGELKAVSGDFTPSDFVCRVTGVDNVCERAAMVGAQELLVRKTPRSGVTVAVAAENWEVRFG